VIRIVSRTGARTYEMFNLNGIRPHFGEILSKIGLSSILVQRRPAPSGDDLIQAFPRARPVLVALYPVFEQVFVTGEHEIHAVLSEKRHPGGSNGCGWALYAGGAVRAGGESRMVEESNDVFETLLVQAFELCTCESNASTNVLPNPNA
jgi:hypothetical protein